MSEVNVEDMVKQYRNLAFSISNRVWASWADRDHLDSIAFEALWKGIQILPESAHENPVPFLATVIRRDLYDYIRVAYGRTEKNRERRKNVHYLNMTEAKLNAVDYAEYTSVDLYESINRVKTFTDNQKKVLHLLDAGHTKTEIASILSVSQSRITQHLRKIREKLEESDVMTATTTQVAA